MSFRICFFALSCMAATLGAGDARADCQAFLSEFFKHAESSRSAVVGFSYVSNQDNGVAGYSEGTPYSGGLYFNQDTKHLQSRTSSYADQMFSDRKTSSCSQTSAQQQPFSVNDVDYIQLDVAPNGDIKLTLSTWGMDLEINNPTCEHNVLYGFGPAAGINNNGLPAMYVFRFFKTVRLS